MRKPEFVQKNETHKILSDFKIQMEHLILAEWWQKRMLFSAFLLF